MTHAPPENTKRFRILVAYDGGAFHGFQIQADVRTVEGELTDALAQLAGQPTKVHGASRTDAGVHAYGQVAHFDYAGEMSAMRLREGLNAIASDDVRVIHCEEAHSKFHSRHKASGKLYRYDLWNDRVHHPLFRRNSLHIKSRLDLAAMQLAADALCGEHDFTSFRASHCSAKSPVLPIERISLVGQPPLVSVHVEGPAFLKHMVRTIVGTLIDVGRGKRSHESMSDLLAAQDRTKAGDTAEAKGLHLVYVRYVDYPWANGASTLTANELGVASVQP